MQIVKLSTDFFFFCKLVAFIILELLKFKTSLRLLGHYRQRQRDKERERDGARDG